jgi:hypothetical protein
MTMTLAVLIALASVLTLALTVGVAVSRALQPSSGANLEEQLQPLDVAAFRNLVDPAEDEYLERHLSARQFRITQRSRLRARAAYVTVAGKNAGVLVRMGQAALAGNDPRIHEAALRLVNDALLLRRNAAFVLVKIYAAMLWPSSSTATAEVIERYERLSNSAMLLGRLRNPGVALRIAAGPS